LFISLAGEMRGLSDVDAILCPHFMHFVQNNLRICIPQSHHAFVLFYFKKWGVKLVVSTI